MRMQFGSLPPVLLHVDLVDRIVADDADSERALGEVLEIGGAALPAVFARFPGPLSADRHRPIDDLPRPGQCGPVLRAVAALRRLAMPFLVVRSADASAEVRFWATYLLGDLHYPDAATALWPRLFDEDGSVRRVALSSAKGLITSNEAGAPILSGLDRVVRSADEAEDRRLLAISLIGELRVYALIPALIGLLEGSPVTLLTAAAQTLEALAKQELGTDARRWKQWWTSKGRARYAP
jgi:hypothetical protein